MNITVEFPGANVLPTVLFQSPFTYQVEVEPSMMTVLLEIVSVPTLIIDVEQLMVAVKALVCAISISPPLTVWPLVLRVARPDPVCQLM